MSDKRKEDLYSIGAIYGDMLNGIKPKLVKEAKAGATGRVGDYGEVGEAPLVAGGPEERGGFKPAAIDIDVMTDKEKDENLYNIKGLTYGDDNNPGIGNQEPQPTGPEFGQVSYTGNVGGPEEDEEGGFEGQPEPTPKAKAHREFRDKYPQRYGPQFYFDDSTGNWHAESGGKVIYRSDEGDEGEENEENEEDEEILSEHGKNARKSLNNFMAKQSVFDKLYNKVMVSEEFEEEFSETEDLEALGVTEEEPEDITVTIPSDLAQTLCDILTAALEEQEVDVETEVDVSETETVDFEEDEEAVMKDGGGYGIDAGSTYSKEINYGKKNKVGNLKPGPIPGA